MTTIDGTYMATREGENYRDAFRDEFGEVPNPDTIGDWDSEAWGRSWADLKRAGATPDDYEPCLEAWRRAFFSGPVN